MADKNRESWWWTLRICRDTVRLLADEIKDKRCLSGKGEDCVACPLFVGNLCAAAKVDEAVAALDAIIGEEA